MFRYWVGGSGNWSDTNHWSTTDGGASGASVPTLDDDVFVTPSSGIGGGTISLDGDYLSAVCHDFISSAGQSYSLSFDTSDFGIYGSAIFESGIDTQSAGTWIYFLSSMLGETITTNGCTLNYISFGDQGYLGGGVGAGGGWTLQDNLAITDTLYMENGTLNANNKNVTVNHVDFEANTGRTPTINLGAGTWSLRDRSSQWYINEVAGQLVTINCDKSTIIFTNTTTGSTEKDFYGAGKTYYNLFVKAGSGTFFVIFGGATFNELRFTNPPYTIWFDNPNTFTVNIFSAVGSTGKLFTIDRFNSVSRFTLSKQSGNVVSNFCTIRNCIATGGAVWYAGANSVDGGNNTGWIFANIPSTPTTVFDAIISNISVTNVTKTSADVTVEILSSVGHTVVERGVVLIQDQDRNPTVNDIKVPDVVGGIGRFTIRVQNLTPGTIYRARGYAIDDLGVSYA